MTAPPPVSHATDRGLHALRRLSRWLSDHPQVTVGAILILGFALRLWRLADQNIWWDEGSSAWQAPMSLAEITLYQARDQHPPLYYWLLHGWYAVTGPSLLALRLFSALWGTLGLAIAYVLGMRLLGNRQAAWMGAFLLAISRFHIEWSQEIKMYVMVGSLSMLSLLFAVEMVKRAICTHDTQKATTWGNRGPVPSEATAGRGHSRSPWGLWTAYVVVTVLAAYTHYIAFLVLAAQNVALLLCVVRAWRRGQPQGRMLLRWAAAQVAVVIAVLPWFLFHAQQSGTWSPSPPQPFAEMARMVATLLAVGTSLHIERYTVQALLLWLVVAMTLWPRRSAAGLRRGVACLWIALLLPWLLTYVLTLPIFGLGYESKLAARFFLLCQTPFSLLLAHGLNSGARRWPWSAWAGLAGATLLLAVPLHSYYAGRYLRDDYGTLTRTIEAYGQPGEAVLLLNDSEWPIFRYEYGGSLPVYQVPYGAAGGDRLISPYVEPAWKQNDGLWVVTIAQALEQDPDRRVGAWLADAGQRVLEESYGERTLALYRKAPRPLHVVDAYSPQRALASAPAAGLLLEGYDQPLAEVRTGRSLRLAMTWRIQDHAEPLRCQAGLVDPQGRAVGPLSELASLDTDVPPYTRQWLRADIAIPTAVGDGRYTVRLYLESPQGASLGIVDLGSVRVVRTMGGDATAAQHALDYRLGNTILLQGYDLKQDGVRAGEAVEVALYWQAAAKADGEYTVFVHVLGETINPSTGNPLWGQVDSLPMQGKYPTSSWLAGDVIVDRYTVTVDPQAPAGRYALEVGLYTASTGERLPIADGNGRALGDHIILAQVTIR
jgi:mannosyltransferase